MTRTQKRPLDRLIERWFGPKIEPIEGEPERRPPAELPIKLLSADQAEGIQGSLDAVEGKPAEPPAHPEHEALMRTEKIGQSLEASGIAVTIFQAETEPRGEIRFDGVSPKEMEAMAQTLLDILTGARIQAEVQPVASQPQSTAAPAAQSQPASGAQSPAPAQPVAPAKPIPIRKSIRGAPQANLARTLLYRLGFGSQTVDQDNQLYRAARTIVELKAPGATNAELNQVSPELVAKFQERLGRLSYLADEATRRLQAVLDVAVYCQRPTEAEAEFETRGQTYRSAEIKLDFEEGGD